MSALVWEHVSVVAGERSLLADVSLAVAPGERVVLVGPNGAGKTTLLRTGLGLIAPSSGRALLEGRPATSWPARERAGAVGWVPQGRRSSEAILAEDQVAAARYRFQEPRRVSLAAAREALGKVGAAALAERAMDRLSGGEAQRVALAALLAQEARTWLLDEPGSHLDPAVQRQTAAALGRLAGEDHALVVVSHDLGLLGLLASADRPEALRVVGLAQGRVHFDLPWTAKGLADALSALFAVQVRRVALDGQEHLVVTGATL